MRAAAPSRSLAPARSPRCGVAAVLGLVAALGACGEESDVPGWPTRNYSGTYALSARVTENDCRAPAFAPGDTLLLEMLHAHDNRAVVNVSPVVSVRGTFRGDRLQAGSAVQLPPAAAAAANPGDSLRYELELEFAGDRVEGTYAVRQPALAGLGACGQTFALDGVQVQRRPPAILPAG